MTKSVYICLPKRTAIGSFQGSLASCAAPELGATVLKAVLTELSLNPCSVDGVIMGNVLSAGVGQAPARQAALLAGLPNSVQALTVNKVCSSGLKAVMLAATDVLAGQVRSVLAGGMESMSRAPYLLPTMRAGTRLGNVEAIDSIIKDGLWDVYNNYHMGSAAELCAREKSITRERQDDFAKESYQRALAAIGAGDFVPEIAAVSAQTGKETTSIFVDEEPGKAKLDKISQLKPAFQRDGTVTAANASSINDGAAAMLVCSEDFLKENNLSPMARVVAQDWHAQQPEWFTTAPIGAVQNLLKRTGKKVQDIDLFEINEAFAAVAIACGSELGISADRLNRWGGAVALGHPIGASGARILTTLIWGLRRTGGKLGVAAICNGGGEATAVMVEAL